MAGYLFYAPRYRPSSPTGGIYPNATITVYLSETTTLSPIYYDVDLTVQLSNPIVADSQGLFPAFYLSPSIAYRVILKDRNGLPIYDTDPYVVLNSPFGTAIASDSNNHISVALPATPGPTLQVAGSSSNLGVGVASSAGNDAAVSFTQTGQTAWKIYQPANSNDIRFNNGSDRLTLDNLGNINVTGNLSVGSTSIIGLTVAKYKINTQSVVSNIILFDDADLVFTSLSIGTYQIDGVLFPANTTTTTQGFQFKCNVPGAGVFGKTAINGIMNGTAINSFTTILTPHTYGNMAVSGDYISIQGLFTAPVVTSFSIQWAQNTTSGNFTSLDQSSFITLTKVA
jgi:hypothetical protein